MKWRASKQQKLVACLQGRLGDYSNKFLKKLLDTKRCRINGQLERFGSRVILPGDFVELAPDWKQGLVSKSEKIAIIYEDAYFKVINKPAGWISEPQNTIKTFGPNHYLVHRLDKETTGLLIIAKSKSIRDEFTEMFRERKIQKQYLALVDGIPRKDGGEIQSFFVKKRSFDGQTIWGSSTSGLSALTKWEKVETGQNTALLLCLPFTGRTHQIRVHLAEMGHPILMDRQYAKTFRSQLFLQRTMLHAYRLIFCFRGKEIDLKAPLFLDMSDVLLKVQMGHFRKLF